MHLRESKLKKIVGKYSLSILKNNDDIENVFEFVEDVITAEMEAIKTIEPYALNAIKRLETVAHEIHNICSDITCGDFGPEFGSELDKDKYIQALADGKIIAVDWSSIGEMLGELPDRLHECSICSNGNLFPPIAERTMPFTEEQIQDIISCSNVQYMAQVNKQGLPYMPPKTRYFSCVQPSAGEWIRRPN